jgi:uncharacterized protein YgiM (DUF1202 family)
MPKFMIVTCLALAWAFYEMSGGAGFEPSQRHVASAAPWQTNPPADQIMDGTAEQHTDIEVTQFRSPDFEVLLAQAHNEFETPTIVSATAGIGVEAVEDEKVDLRLVAGNQVNMREGPSTNHPVLATVSRGTQAEVIAVNGDGWARIRLIDSGASGWMAARLLSEG